VTLPSTLDVTAIGPEPLMRSPLAGVTPVPVPRYTLYPVAPASASQDSATCPVDGVALTPVGAAARLGAGAPGLRGLAPPPAPPAPPPPQAASSKAAATIPLNARFASLDFDISFSILFFTVSIPVFEAQTCVWRYDPRSRVLSRGR